MQMVVGMHDPAQCALLVKVAVHGFVLFKNQSVSQIFNFFFIFVDVTQLSICLKEHSTDFTHGD